MDNLHDAALNATVELERMAREAKRVRSLKQGLEEEKQQLEVQVGDGRSWGTNLGAGRPGGDGEVRETTAQLRSSSGAPQAASSVPFSTQAASSTPGCWWRFWPAVL